MAERRLGESGTRLQLVRRWIAMIEAPPWHRSLGGYTIHGSASSWGQICNSERLQDMVGFLKEIVRFLWFNHRGISRHSWTLHLVQTLDVGSQLEAKTATQMQSIQVMQTFKKKLDQSKRSTDRLWEWRVKDGQNSSNSSKVSFFRSLSTAPPFCSPFGTQLGPPVPHGPSVTNGRTVKHHTAAQL